MVDLNKIAKNLKVLPLEEQEAIVNLIQLKTETDMDKVLNKLDAMEAKFEAKLEAMDSKFETKLEAMDSKFDILRWLLMAIIAIIPIAFTIFGYLNK